MNVGALATAFWGYARSIQLSHFTITPGKCLTFNIFHKSCSESIAIMDDAGKYMRYYWNTRNVLVYMSDLGAKWCDIGKTK